MIIFELAPMEGITGYIYRNAYARHFGGMERYYTPFIAGAGFVHRQLQDVLPEHNRAFVLGEEENDGKAGHQAGDSEAQNPARPRLIPQILSNRTEDFLAVADSLGQMGYTHVNLNLGCPSGTVASKGRGAGFLGFPERLEAFLDEIFDRCPLRISIKTRIGVEDTAEWERLSALFTEYPLEELILHPRLQQDFYRNPVRPEAAAAALTCLAKKGSPTPFCYNGDIHSPADFETLRERFPQIGRVMLGRGVLKNPLLTRQLAASAGNLPAAAPDSSSQTKVLRAFHEELFGGYQEVMSGDRNTLFKMKELWSYWGDSFPQCGKALKQIRKAADLPGYRAAVKEILG